MSLTQYYRKLIHVQNEIKYLCGHSNDHSLDDALGGIANAIGHARGKLIDEEARKYRQLKGIKLWD